MSLSLHDNIMNRSVREDQPKVKLWRSAGIMMTYWCSARCACCYVFSGPTATDEATEMSAERALACWRGIRELAGASGSVHLTGGEPFGNYDRLRRILQVACEERLEGLEKIETNAYWCTDDDITRQRLEELKRWGLRKLQISTDIYHQEYVPIERVWRGFRLAADVLGQQPLPPPPPCQTESYRQWARQAQEPIEGIQVRWREDMLAPSDIGNVPQAERVQCFKDVLARRGERLLGRAAAELAPLLPRHDAEEFRQVNCWANLAGAKHVHIDGAGNVFPGTCVGIVVGNLTDGSLDALWRQFDPRRHPIISVLAGAGPFGLLDIAEQHGYQRQAGYASKCHLCYQARRFLFSQGLFDGFLGPGLCYGCAEPAS